MVATTGMLFATSCSSDDVVMPTGEDELVTFTICAENANGSRAISDGSKANKLIWSVYNVNGEVVTFNSGLSGTKTIEGNFLEGYDVRLRLAKGQTYSVAFWAQDADCEAYEIQHNNLESVKIKANHFNDVADCGDAFCRTITFTAGGSVAQPVLLYRPFAQVNVGVSMAEWNAAVLAGQNVEKAAVTIKQVATTLNVVDGSVSDPADFVCTATDILPNDEILYVDVDCDGESEHFKWLSTCYVLPNADPAENSSVVAAEYTFTGTGTPITLNSGLENMPIQRNYRTNIIGDFLTTDVNIHICVDRAFQYSDKNIDVWDGETTEEPALVEGVYNVSNAAQWVWLAERGQVSNDIKLVGEINFGYHMTPYIMPAKANFVLDGNGHSIKNVRYKESRGMANYQMGLITLEIFNNPGSNVTVKNLTLDGVNCWYNGANDYGYASALIADTQNGANVLIDGVTVCKSDIQGVQGVGGLVGYVAAGSTVTVKNSTVTKNFIHNKKVENESGYVCGVAGRVVGTLNVDNTVVVEDNAFEGYFASRRGGKSIDAVAAADVNNGGVVNGTAQHVNNRITRLAIEHATTQSRQKQSSSNSLLTTEIITAK